MECVLRVEKQENGYTVEVRTPDKPAKASATPMPYVDPWKSYVFKDVASVTKFITKVLPGLKVSGDEYENAFMAAASEADDE